MTKCLVIIPTYNEAENVRDIISEVLAQGAVFHVLVIDDNSPDGTAALVEAAIPSYQGRLHLLKRKGKLGLATAYLEGFRYGIQHDYDYIFEMDADFSHNPKDLSRLLQPVEANECDVAIGSRYVKGGGLKNWPFDRIFLSYAASWYVRLITQMWIKDPTAGFVCYHTNVLKTLDLNKIHFNGYAFQIEMKYSAAQKGFRLLEVPITFVDRVKGISKMNSKIITEAISGVLKLKWRAIRGYYK